MHDSSEQQIVLTCEDCREELVVFGPEADWRSRDAVFACVYGHKLTLDGRADEEVFSETNLQVIERLCAKTSQTARSSGYRHMKLPQYVGGLDEYARLWAPQPRS